MAPDASYTVQVNAQGNAIVCKGARVRAAYYVTKRGTYAECKQFAERYGYPLRDAA
jgi:hypothetical protein